QHLDAVVTPPADATRGAAVPDDLQVLSDEPALIVAALLLGLRLQAMTAVPAHRIIHGQAEAGRGGPGARRVPEDVHATETSVAGDCLGVSEVVVGLIGEAHDDI